MTVILSAIAFFLLLSFLVMIHELGHFSVARWFGVIVEEFGFGLPPRVKTVFEQGGTKFTINSIPFGGFVRLKGENAIHPRDRKAIGSFARASILGRILILVAGVFMNFMVAVTLFCVGFTWLGWVPTYLSFDQLWSASQRGEIVLQPGVFINGVIATGTAKVAGVPEKSLLLAVDQQPVYAPSDIVALQKGKQQVVYDLRSTTGERQLITVPVQDGKTGVELEFMPQINTGSRTLWRGVHLAMRETWVVTVQSIQGVGTLASSLLMRAKVPEGVTGIVGIAVLTHETVKEGLSHYLRLVAILSLSLAALNILPFPALDGGRLMFVLYEWVARKPAPRKFELTINAIGFVMLLSLIVIVTYHDLARFF